MKMMNIGNEDMMNVWWRCW